MNRCWPNELLFDSPQRYQGFVRLIGEVQVAHPVRILALCLMPNHWHFILQPTEDTQISKFIGVLTQTQAARLRLDRGNVGAGPVYPRRYLAVHLPAELNAYRAIRYVERNPIKGGLRKRAEDWPYSSASLGLDASLVLSPWPSGRPRDWLAYINEEERPNALAALRAQMYDTSGARRLRT